MEGNLKKLGNLMANTAVKYKRRPRYTVVLHDVREKSKRPVSPTLLASLPS
jgi:hypothetical protein